MDGLMICFSVLENSLRTLYDHHIFLHRKRSTCGQKLQVSNPSMRWIGMDAKVALKGATV